MASRFFGLNRGGDEFSITDASSTSGTDIELRVDLSKNVESGEIVFMLRQIENSVLKSKNLRLNANG